MAKQSHDFTDAWTFPRQPAKGVDKLWLRVLSRDEETGDYTAIVEFAPGCDTSPNGVQVHEFWEEVWILEGSLYDVTAKKTFHRGMYAIRAPGEPHGPFITQEGAKNLEICYYKKK